MFTYRSLYQGEYWDLPSRVTMNMGFSNSEIVGGTIEYPVDGVNADKVVIDATIIAYYNGTEVLNGRWWLLGDSGSTLRDDQPTKVLTGKNLLTPFDKTVVHTATNLTVVPYTNTTVGAILIDLIQAAQARGALTGFTWDFTATNDSNGAAWTTGRNANFEILKTYYDVIRSLNDMGWAEFQLNGMVLQAYNFGTMGRDQSATVTLISGRDYTETPYKVSAENRAQAVLVAGDDLARAEYVAAGTAGPYGQEEAGVSQGGSTTGSLAEIAYRAATDAFRITEEYTRKVVATGSSSIPLVDYRVGDKVTEQVGGTATVRTIVTMAVGSDTDGILEVSLVFDNRIPSWEERQAKTTGAVVSGTGTIPGTPRADTNPDTSIPNPPTTLAATTGVYLNNGGATIGYLSVDWVAPTLNTDGSALSDLAGYEINWRVPAVSATWQSAITPASPFFIDNLTPGTSVDVRVRARDNANPPNVSAWTATSSFVSSADTIPPPTPSALTTSSRLATVQVTWNGLGSAGEAMPKDFDYLAVHMSNTNAFVPSSATLIGTMYKATALTVANVAVGDVKYFRTITYDKTGNASAASATSSITVLGVAGPDIVANAITANKIAVGAVSAEQIALGTFSTNLISDPSFEESYPIVYGGTRTDQWHLMAAPGASNAVGRSPYPRSGAKDCTLNVGATAPTTSYLRLRSGAVAVVPGKTYVMSVNLAKGSSTVPKVYLRIAGGSTPDCTEYPADGLASSVPFQMDNTSAFEAMDVPQLVSPHDPAAFGGYSAQFVVPTGINYVALEVWNYQPPAALSLHIDDASIVEFGKGATEITSAGVRLFGTEGTEVAAFVSNRPNYFSVTDGVGNTLASIDDAGGIAGKTLAVTGTDTNADGTPDTGLMVYGTEFSDWLNPFPKGIVGFDNFTTAAGYSAQVGIREIAFVAEPGRSYRVHFSGGLIQSSLADKSGGFFFRLTIPASVGAEAPTPTLSNGTLLGYSYATYPVASLLCPCPAWDYVLRCPSTGVATDGGEITAGINKLLIAMNPPTSATLTPYGSVEFRWWIEDIGPFFLRNGEANDGGGTGTTKKTYTKTYSSTSWAMYQASGARKTNASDVQQGWDSYNGDSKGVWIFPSFTTDLAGSTVNKIEAYLYANHWWYNSGGTGLIKVHGYSAYPASAPALTTALSSPNWPKPGGRWVTLPSSLYAGFISGTYKGIGVGPAGTTNQLYYGRFNTGTQIRITYTK